MKELTAFKEKLNGCIAAMQELAKAIEETVAEEPVKEEKAKLTLEEVRAVCTKKARAGFTDDVKAILTNFGVEKLSDIPEDKFEALLKEVEVLGNAN